MARTTPEGPRPVRVVSYNIHACVGTDGEFSPQRIADVLTACDADFIALQEVEECDYRGRVVSEFLRASLGFCIAGKTMHKRAGTDFGNLLLSRVAPSTTNSHDLAYARREPRAAIEASFELGEHRLRVFVTHFGLSMRERREQLRRLLPSLDDSKPDLTVLCADFNEWLPWSRVHRSLRRALGAAPALRSFPSRFPTLPLDRIYASPRSALVQMRTVATRETRVASDHLPIVAELDLALAHTLNTQAG